MVDKDRVKGTAKTGAGKLTGDEKMKAGGQVNKARGKIQSAVGSAKDKARDATDRV